MRSHGHLMRFRRTAVSHAVIRLRRVQRSQLFALFWPTITTLKLCCRFSNNPRT